MLNKKVAQLQTAELFKHPPSLRVFFATEMWERYGFYVVQSLLALYLSLHFKWQDDRVYSLVGSFTALTYLAPVIGGYIADNLLGQKRAILIGAFFLLCSYLTLSFFTSDLTLPFSLAGIAVGTGLLKPNISSLLGNEYPPGSAKRESGFTIFYMGITSGIILGTTLPSILQDHFGWAVCFLSAAFGMIIAIAIFSYGIYLYKIKDYHPFELRFKNILKAACLLFLLWLLCFSMLYYPQFANSAFISIVILSLFYLLYTIRHEPLEQARQTAVIALLCIISVMFWPFYFQMFLSWTLLISRIAEPTLFGIDFPPPYYVGIQSAGMIIFGLFLARDKKALTLKQSGKRTSNKFLISMFFITVAFGLIALLTKDRSNTLLSPLYFIPAYLMLSISELLLSPVGLAAITVLASRKKVSTMMGIFFVSLGIGGFLSGKLASLTAIKGNVSSFTVSEFKIHYEHGFSQLFYILLAILGISVILNYLIKYLLAEKK